MKDKDRSREQLLDGLHEIGELAVLIQNILDTASFDIKKEVFINMRKIIDITAMTEREFELWMKSHQTRKAKRVRQHEGRPAFWDSRFFGKRGKVYPVAY